MQEIATLRTRIGQEIAVSDWLCVDQDRINDFAAATGDLQWIHTDVERAQRESPFGGTVAHGYLTLSLLATFAQQCLRRPQGVRLSVNYGLNRVRFPSPVRAGSRVRARFALQQLEDIEGGTQLCWGVTVEIEGQAKPACVAEMLSRWMH